MRPLTVIALAAVVGLIASQFEATAAKPAPSSDPATARFQLVGFTSEEFAGRDLGGIFGAYLKCQIEFSSSRMCTLKEVAETVAIPDLMAGQTAWVWNTVGGSECGQWRDVTTQGKIVRSDGSSNALGERDCTELHHIACCALVP